MKTVQVNFNAALLVNGEFRTSVPIAPGLYVMSAFLFCNSQQDSFALRHSLAVGVDPGIGFINLSVPLMAAGEPQTMTGSYTLNQVTTALSNKTSVVFNFLGNGPPYTGSFSGQLLLQYAEIELK